MGIRVNAFRGQGVRIEGRGYGVIHGFVSPTEVRVKFREGFEMIRIDELLPVVVLDSVGTRFEEREFEIELADPVGRRDNEIEPDVTDEESEEI